MAPSKPHPKKAPVKGAKKQAHSVTRLNYSKKPAAVQAQVSKKAKVAAIKAVKAAKETAVSSSVVAKAAPSSNWKMIQSVRNPCHAIYECCFITPVI